MVLELNTFLQVWPGAELNYDLHMVVIPKSIESEVLIMPWVLCYCWTAMTVAACLTWSPLENVDSFPEFPQVWQFVLWVDCEYHPVTICPCAFEAFWRSQEMILYSQSLNIHDPPWLSHQIRPSGVWLLEHHGKKNPIRDAKPVVQMHAISNRNLCFHLPCVRRKISELPN